MKILLAGAGGQLGQALAAALAPLGTLVTASRDGRGADRALDLANPGEAAAAVAALAPDLVVNAAAYTAVDRAEDEPDLAWRVNAAAVEELATACAASGARLVHFSTDYVFPGDATRPYRESDPTGPLGVYGASKLAGEQAVRAAGASHQVFRLCWVHSPVGHNFLRTMLRLAAEREVLRVVDDQQGCPTPAHWIAAAVARAQRTAPDAVGTWHLAASGQCSWHGFARAILDAALARGLLPRLPRLEAVPGSAYPTRARRPAFSVLDTTAFAATFGGGLPDWRQGMDEVLDRLAARGDVKG